MGVESFLRPLFRPANDGIHLAIRWAPHLPDSVGSEDLPRSSVFRHGDGLGK
jgi:hypothetical protein